jgi:heterodisulfide reductase subunit B
MGDSQVKLKLFAGCVISNRLPFIEKSAHLTFEKLNVILENEAFTCCPDPIGINAISEKMWLTLAARNLALGEKDDREILALCNGCSETLLVAKYTLKRDKNLLKEINGILEKKGYNYQGKAKVTHFVTFLREKIGINKIEKIVKETWENNKESQNPIKGLKIAAHPGCHFTRPSHILKVDDPHNPIYLEELIQAIGAIPVKYKEKTLCCGAAVAETSEDIRLELSKKKYQNATDEGAQLFAVNCPTCFSTLEANQRRVNKKFQTNFNIPVFYITELMAMAFGYTNKEIGFKFHGVKDKSKLFS